MHRVTACKAEDDYKLWIRFDDGLEGSVFLGNLLEIGAFKLWRDVREFEKVSVDPESATVTWEGGIRLDPEILYQDPHRPPRAARSWYRISGSRRMPPSQVTVADTGSTLTFSNSRTSRHSLNAPISSRLPRNTLPSRPSSKRIHSL